MAITERFKNFFKALTSRDPTRYETKDLGASYYTNPSRVKLTRGVDRTIVNSFINRVAVDCITCKLQHVKLDEEGRFIEEVDSPINFCFNQMANIDQTGRDFLKDCVISLLDEGYIAVYPSTASRSIYEYDTFEVYEMRTAKITEWFPKSIRIHVYNQDTGKFEDIVVPKASVAIVENPFYQVMNEPNSILQRLIHKLALIDTIDDQNASGKLDLIIQLPYVLKTEQKKTQAEERRGQIEAQLAGSKYGIAYIDGTEHITQLNRPVENNLMAQVEYLTKLFYNQMGITEELMNGSADEDQKNEYFNHIIEPILTAISEAMNVKFLSLTARTQHEAIRFYRTPLKMVSPSQMAELADKFTRNEILTGNEIRQIIGLKPSMQPSADELRNKNNNATPVGGEGMVGEEPQDPLADLQNFKADLSELQEFDKKIEELQKFAHMYSDDYVLIHRAYSSEYYDPDKAHEYYEQHKQLKGYANRYGGVGGRGGKVSTKGLNEKGREIASIVKTNITNQRQLADEDIKTRVSNMKEGNKKQRKVYIDQIKSQLSSSIANLQQQLQGMNEAQRKHAKIKIRAKIEDLQAEADDLRQQLSEHYKQVSEELAEYSKTELEKNRADADSKYAEEIQKMLQDPSLVGGKGKSSSKKEGHKLAVVRNRGK